MQSDVLIVRTDRQKIVDITDDAARFVADKGDGLLNVFVQHATAGVAVIETGSGTEQDLEAAIDRWLPPDVDYVHRHGRPGHGADHVLPAIVAPSITVPVSRGVMQLGTWQRLVLVDPNEEKSQRSVLLSLLG